MDEPAPAWPRWVALGLAALAVGGGLFMFRPWRASGPPPAPPEVRSADDLRLSYAGPFRNVRPDVKFVGDAACADCHKEIAEAYHQHPMGRSMADLASAPTPPLDRQHHNPFDAFGTTLRVERTGGHTIHHASRDGPNGRPAYDWAVEVSHALGSGAHAQSYVWAADGYVFQSPITWYEGKQFWAGSPGFNQVSGGRPVEGRCLFCHANRVEPLPGYVNRYATPLGLEASIGCERCHGPGELHVAKWTGAAAAKGELDDTIVNPKRLDPHLRDGVCRQCHMEGETRIVKRGRGLNDYRPGMPLEAFWVLIVRSGQDDDRVLNHFEQMEQSHCFQRSAGKLDCTTCHDAHRKPAAAERAVHYRKVCQSCHADRPCTVPEAERRKTQPDDSCTACHMPTKPAVDAPHLSPTDHRIRSRPTPLGEPPPARGPVRLIHRPDESAMTAEDRRDLGVAMGQLLDENKVPPQEAGKALALLEEALASVPDDPPAWEAKSLALEKLGRAADAMAAYREALKRDPDNESYLAGAGLLALNAGWPEDAIGLMTKAMARNPYRSLYPATVAVLHARVGRWRDGAEASAAWAKLEPNEPEARRLRARYLLHLGDRPAADKEFAVVEAMRPPNLEELRRSWALEVKQVKQ